jgi:hypothetical protein
MQRQTRRTMLDAIDQLATALAYGYTDSTHDAFDLIVDRLRYAHTCEEAEMNGQPLPTFNDFFHDLYGHDLVNAEQYDAKEER